VNPQLLLYNLFLVAAAPVLLPLKVVRYLRRHEDYEVAPDRLFAPSLPAKTKKTRVVFVALSWGETAMLDRLSRDLEASEKVGQEIEIVWSIREKAAREMAKPRFPNRMLAPMPFDFVLAAKNWQRAVDADVVIAVEKFWWPNLLWSAKSDGASIILVNGRSRGRKSIAYKLLSGYQRFILSAFDVLMFGDEAQIERIRDVLPTNAQAIATGNIKFAFDQIAPPATADSLEQWVTQASDDKPLFMAGSTHQSDEDWLVESFPFERATLLLAPRNLKRADEVAARFEKEGKTVSRRSAPLEGKADILLLDSMGELPYVYKWANAAYVGGAVSSRGHNILEPLAHNVPVAYGPNRGDFEGAQKAAEEFGVGFRLNSAEELKAYWESALNGQMPREEMEKRAALLFESQRAAMQVTLQSIENSIIERHQKSA